MMGNKEICIRLPAIEELFNSILFIQDNVRVYKLTKPREQFAGKPTKNANKQCAN